MTTDELAEQILLRLIGKPATHTWSKEELTATAYEVAECLQKTKEDRNDPDSN